MSGQVTHGGIPSSGEMNGSGPLCPASLRPTCKCPCMGHCASLFPPMHSQPAVPFSHPGDHRAGGISHVSVEPNRSRRTCGSSCCLSQMSGSPEPGLRWQLTSLPGLSQQHRVHILPTLRAQIHRERLRGREGSLGKILHRN